MSEMIERVALAISGGDDPASILAIHRHRARAALKAMREPTNAMIKGCWGKDKIPDPTPRGVLSRNAMWRRRWRAMIDIALE